MTNHRLNKIINNIMVSCTFSFKFCSIRNWEGNAYNPAIISLLGHVFNFLLTYKNLTTQQYSKQCRNHDAKIFQSF